MTEYDDLAARVAVLDEENQRLRDEYVRARQVEYRRTATALGIVGILAIFCGVAFPVAQTVLFALGGTGVFAGILTYYLVPDRVVSAKVGERAYTALAESWTAAASDLGLQDERVYVPTQGAVRLFVPQHTKYELPDSSLDTGFAVTADDRSRGVVLEPTGERLYREFEQAAAGNPASDPHQAAERLVDGLRDQFELVDRAMVDGNWDAGQLTVGVSGSVYGRPDRFDHPVASFLAVGMARALDEPVTVDVAGGDGDRADALVVCSWNPE